MPFSWIVGQENIKLALKLAYIMGPLGGVLIRGKPGTGKSTIARAFAQMVYKKLPVTLPINATVDRVVGGLDIESLLQMQEKWHDGLLSEARDEMLYIDEVNLLDDHIVNIILDAISTTVLEVQHQGTEQRKEASCFLVGTMNPEEGELRPQLLDRFGLVVDEDRQAQVGQVQQDEVELRRSILERVLLFDEQRWLREQDESKADLLAQARKVDEEIREQLIQASQKYRGDGLPGVDVTGILELCVTSALKEGVMGHRGERTLLFAAKAHAALQAVEKGVADKPAVATAQDVEAVGSMALAHRSPDWLRAAGRRRP
jgi:magnesium chelatase subunit I